MNFPNSSLSPKSHSLVSSADTAFSPLAVSDQTLTTALFSRHASLLFIDPTIADYQSLVAGAAPGTEVHVLNGAQDAVSQITNVLLGREGIDSIHIVSHGDVGRLDFSDSLLNLSDVPKYIEQIQSWSKSLTDDADILLYGCNVAEGELGKAFVQILSQLTGADVAASNNLTGSASLGGDWELEFNTGSIESSLAFQESVLQGYSSVFSHFASGTLNWVPTGGNTVKFEGFVTYRSSAYGGVTLGSIPASIGLDFGDGTSQSVPFRVIEVNASSDLFIAEIGTGSTPQTFQTGVTKTYTAAGNYSVVLNGSGRLQTLKNNANLTSRMEATVTVGVGNAAPTTDFPSGFQVVDNTIANVQITTSDADGDTLRYRLATTAEQGGSPHTQPPGLSVDSTTGVLTFDVRDSVLSTVPGDRWNAQVIVEDLNSQGTVKSKISLDLAILVSGTNVAPTASAGGPYSVLEGGSIQLSGTASDPDGFVIAREWDFNYDGVTFDVDATGAFPTFVAGSAGTKTVAFRAKDSIGATTISTTTVTIAPDPTNNAPVNTVQGVINMSEDIPLAFTGVNAIQISDPDAGTNPIRTTLTVPVAAGTLSATASGATITGNGTNSLVINGAVPNINSTLSSLVFTPTANYNRQIASGAINLTVLTNDLGNTGTGGAKTDTDLISITINPVNDLPTGATTISETAQVNQPLAANTSTLNDADGLGTFSYQWQVVAADHVTWNNIAGATSASFTPNSSFQGGHVRVRVTYTDGGGNVETVYSNMTNHIEPANHTPTGNVVINGTVQEDQTLTANTSGLADQEGLGTFSYQWQQSSDGNNWTNVSGATGGTFAPGDNQVGQKLRVQVSYTDGQGNPESVVSDATVNVANVNDAPTGNAVITGTVQEDQPLTINANGVGDADGLGTFSYQWQQSSDGVNWISINGATGNNFTPGDTQVGQKLRVQISYVDGKGTAETVYSTPTATTVINVNDAPVGNVAITGTVQEDQPLTADTSGLSDPDGLGTFSYQWQQSTDGNNWTSINGATAVNFTPGDTQVGQKLRVQVSYTDGRGTPESVTSAETTTVTNVNDLPTGNVTVTGTVQENQSLTADTTGLADADGLGTFNYQWQQSLDGINWNNITGATNVNFTPDDAQVGYKLRVRVSYTDGQSASETVFSTATTTAVANVNDAPSGNVTIPGTVQEDQQIAANTNTLTDPDGLGTFSYQWQESTDGNTWTNVTGATNVNFTPGDTQVGKKLRVQVSYTDGQGTPESVFSNATTTAVTNVNDTPSGNVTIPSTVQEDQQITANTSTLTDPDGLGTFSYQWQESTDGNTWTNITGATSVNFTPGDAQVGKRLRTQVSYTDGQGTAELVFSNTTVTAVTNVNDTPSGNVTITGTVQEDQQLTADTSGLTDGDGLGTFSYQWQESTDGVTWTAITGATSVNFTPADAQVGKKLRTQVSYTDGHGTVESVFSSATANVTGVNDAPTVTAPASINVVENTASPINNISFADVDAGPGNVTVTFTVQTGTLTATSGNGVTVGGTATSRTLTGTLSAINAFIAANSLKYTTANNSTTAQTLNVAIADDGAGGTGGTQTATASVSLPVTPQPAAVSITNVVSHSEGTRGNKTYTYTVTLSKPRDQNVTVNYATADGTATIADSDYTAASGTLIFTPGQTSKTFDVIATGDKKLEGTERFTVNLSGLTGDATIANGTGTAIIGDDDGNGSDFNLDGKVDFFWRNASTSENQFWIMNNTNFSAVAILPIAEPEWKVEGFADFNDDGIDDVLWHNMKDARVVVWTLNASGFAGFTNLGTVSPNLRVADLGDYDGDNKIDIFWRNASTAENVIWKMNGTSFVSFTNLAQADSTWSVVDTGDFDGDGDLDIFWRKTDGSNSIWQLNNATFGTFTNLAVAQPNLVVGDIADFDNDGKLDILWHNNSSGENVIWKMNGVALQSFANIAASPGYKAENVVDLDRDGKLEIIWRRYSDGKNVAWHMNGTALNGFDELLAAVPNWVPYFP